MNALVVKLSMAAAAAVAFVPFGGGDEPTTQATGGPKIVYVVGTTTTAPPHVWVTYDENASPVDSVDVLLIQQALQSFGYKVAADGVYGPKTEAAVREFQLDHHLWVDGIVGPVTARALGLDDVLGHTNDPPVAPPSTWTEG